VSEAGLLDHLRTLPQHLLPQQLLTAGANRISNSHLLARPLIAGFRRLFDIDLSEYQVPEQGFSCFNEFFTRALKDDARTFPEDRATIACPCDGTISQIGRVEQGRLLQAKGRDYSLEELLADPDWAQRLDRGRFATIYLAPYDYHRVHLPFDGELQRELRIPGRLFSVSATTARTVDRLFARNERVVALFQTEYGPAAVVMVAAMLVAGIETPWSGPEATRPGKQVQSRDFVPPRPMRRGDELGRFHWGSTVIVVTGADAPAWQENLAAGQQVRLGQPLSAPANRNRSEHPPSESA